MNVSLNWWHDAERDGLGSGGSVSEPGEFTLDKNPISKWVPVALVPFSSDALMVPIVMLHRHRAATLSMADTPPPPRHPIPSTSTSASSSMAARAEDSFNGALHSAKAFGIATLMVGVGAAGTKTQEFANMMRDAIFNRLPSLSARIHRPPELRMETPNCCQTLMNIPRLYWTSPRSSWREAERRFRDASDKHGFYGWAAAAIHELEAEGRRESEKRGRV
ncbi:hypothetical protein BD309DRAFT_866466 [Dichomitus squalens]|uniref:Uncharacterized protein n=1 Tax=Dichomitus squalens TaxID=114155 RepID=A0A4Q9NQX3_9APHY|nr:hypothetical protein BD309DRAFT_866466 [Dichomitus squalens]TBU62714.1 hypothetical protein BD310DRAFT_810094 [Dichomitus squalens]